jgi:hypothetical protein
MLASMVMLVRFRQPAAGLQCSLVETHRIDGAVRYEQVASLGPVPASPSVSGITFWRRVERRSDPDRTSENQPGS